MGSNLLLINPPVYDFAAYNLWARPLGLLYLASHIRRAGFSIEYLDCLAPCYEKTQIEQDTTYIAGKTRRFATAHYFKKEVERPAVYKNMRRRYYRFGIDASVLKELLLSSKKPDAVLVTSIMTYWYPGVFEVIRAVKTVYPNVPVILGGIYATLCYDHAVARSKADLVVRGGDIDGLITTLSGMLNHERDSHGCVEPSRNGTRFSVYPALDLNHENRFIPLLTSTGCTYRCKYCASLLISGAFCERSPACIIAEIEHWCDRYPVSDIAFYDDALLYRSERRVMPVLQAVIDRSIRVNFHTPNGMHIRFITRETAALMREAGFKTLRFGFEGMRGKVREDSDNKVDNRMFEKALGILFDAGFTRSDLGIYLLMGTPGQRPEDVIKSIGYLKSLGVTPKICEYSPIPFTAYFEQSQRMTSADLMHEPLYHNNSALEVWSPVFNAEVIRDIKSFAAH